MKNNGDVDRHKQSDILKRYFIICTQQPIYQERLKLKESALLKEPL